MTDSLNDYNLDDWINRARELSDDDLHLACLTLWEKLETAVADGDTAGAAAWRRLAHAASSLRGERATNDANFLDSLGIATNRADE